MSRTVERPAAPKRPYRTPELKIHGDFRTLTSVKDGSAADGTGKPKTKSSGPNAA
jgi:hypothetical protein